ncbi:MAG: monomeric [FeFe] hydrogenase [Mycoplasmoidaceae bacterium]|nr:monomeric [FeFe] hydrogenase [Mycoplasmoidaceae bacterium]
MGGYTVTESCRGCIGHACKQACPKGAISVDGHHRAHIDKEKCVNCGLCSKACPFGAIYNFRRPCQKACPTGAITMDENLSAKIDYSKCIVCGSCTQKCPFGAIAAKTFITFVIDHIRNNILATKKRPIYAIVAPAIATQFNGIKLEQIIEGIMQLGFTNVVEAALGADVVAENEAKELVEKKILTTSCCPAFVAYIKKFHPELKNKISHNVSPMAQTGKLIKAKHPDALTIFIGPCTAKKDERSLPDVRPFVDYVLTFTELRAMFAARDIEVEKLKGIALEDASPFGRAFAKIGGVSEAVVQALKEVNLKDFQLSSLACSGMKECIKAIESLAAGTSKYNFIEGMACEGGCVCGPESLNHNAAVGRSFVQAYAKSSKHKTLKESIDKSGARELPKASVGPRVQPRRTNFNPQPNQPGLRHGAFTKGGFMSFGDLPRRTIQVDQPGARKANAASATTVAKTEVKPAATKVDTKPKVEVKPAPAKTEVKPAATKVETKPKIETKSEKPEETNLETKVDGNQKITITNPNKKDTAEKKTETKLETATDGNKTITIAETKQKSPEQELEEDK